MLDLFPEPLQYRLRYFRQECIFFYNPPPQGGKETKGLRAREEIQRRVKKKEREGKGKEKQRKGQKENEGAKGKEEKGQGMRMKKN
jgi:hypothetical protein